MVEAHVMWDMTTGRSRGYGFVTFRNQEDAQNAIQSMNGEWLGSRTIRCNWASQKQQQQQGMPYNNHQQQIYHQQSYGSGPVGSQQGQGQMVGDQQQGQYMNQPAAVGSQSQAMVNPMGMGVVNPSPMYDIIVRQAPNWQTTVYLGNIPNYAIPNDLLPVLQNFGYVVDIKYQQEREYAFIKYDTHEHAAVAISQLSGAQFSGRTLRCGWGKDRHQGNHHMNYGRQYNR